MIAKLEIKYTSAHDESDVSAPDKKISDKPSYIKKKKEKRKRRVFRARSCYLVNKRVRRVRNLPVWHANPYKSLIPRAVRAWTLRVLAKRATTTDKLIQQIVQRACSYLRETPQTSI